jgi:hypothetical protein
MAFSRIYTRKTAHGSYQASKHFGRPTVTKPVQTMPFRKQTVQTVCRKDEVMLKRKHVYDICSSVQFEHLYEY